MLEGDLCCIKINISEHLWGQRTLSQACYRGKIESSADFVCLQICSSSRKSQHRVGGVWRLPKVDLPTHLLVHSEKSPLSCFCLCHLLSLVPRSNILSSALETHSLPLKCQTLRSPSPSPPATYCFRRAPLGA